MLEGTLFVCDACKVDDMMLEPSVISASSWPGNGWVVEEWQVGPDVHFCPRHADPDGRARLAEGFMAVCARCGRTSKDDPPMKQWWGGYDDDGQRVTVCNDCHDSARDATRL